MTRSAATRKLDTLPQVHVESRAQWRAWLRANHLRSDGVWLVTWKAATGKPRLPYDEAVEELLCFGWIDSRPRMLDAQRTMLLCTPRGPKSRWSAKNRERAARMIAAGKMAPRGLELVEAAKASGTWDALDEVEALSVPRDLRDALAAHPPATERFAAFPPSVRRGILEWILAARKPETRAKRIAETATLAARGIRANQWPRAT